MTARSHTTPTDEECIHLANAYEDGNVARIRCNEYLVAGNLTGEAKEKRIDAALARGKALKARRNDE